MPRVERYGQQFDQRVTTSTIPKSGRVRKAMTIGATVLGTGGLALGALATKGGRKMAKKTMGEIRSGQKITKTLHRTGLVPSQAGYNPTSRRSITAFVKQDDIRAELREYGGDLYWVDAKRGSFLWFKDGNLDEGVSISLTRAETGKTLSKGDLSRGIRTFIEATPEAIEAAEKEELDLKTLFINHSLVIDTASGRCALKEKKSEDYNNRAEMKTVYRGRVRFKLSDRAQQNIKDIYKLNRDSEDRKPVKKMPKK